MRKLTRCLALVLIGAITLTGCGKKEKAYGGQFDKVKKGETVAEIVIKDFGSINVKFFPDKAPKAVENFVTHAKEGYYDGLTFHRIINEFMIQGGDPEGTGTGGESIWNKDFEDEFSDDLHPVRGALCMANAGPNTNGSQFFIVQSHPMQQEDIENVLTVNKMPVGKTFLESYTTYVKEVTGVSWGDDVMKIFMEKGGAPWLQGQHTVFGQIYDDASYDVLDAVAGVEKADEQNGIPANNVIIEKINITEYK